MTIAIIIGAILLLGILFTLWSAKNTVTGVCPQCNNKIGLLKGLGCCSHCGEPLRKQGDHLVPVENGFVSDSFNFSISMGKLKDPKKWQTTWQGRCCICGNAAIGNKKINVKTIGGSTGPLLGPQVNITEKSAFEVGYCNGHKDGIRFVYPPGFGNTKHTDQCYLYFRSVDFYRHFMSQNRR